MLYLLASYSNGYLVSDLWQQESITRHESYFRRSGLAQLRKIACIPWQSTANRVISLTVFIQNCGILDLIDTKCGCCDDFVQSHINLMDTLISFANKTLDDLKLLTCVWALLGHFSDGKGSVNHDGSIRESELALKQMHLEMAKASRVILSNIKSVYGPFSVDTFKLLKKICESEDSCCSVPSVRHRNVPR